MTGMKKFEYTDSLHVYNIVGLLHKLHKLDLDQSVKRKEKIRTFYYIVGYVMILEKNKNWRN